MSFMKNDFKNFKKMQKNLPVSNHGHLMMLFTFDHKQEVYRITAGKRPLFYQ